MVGGIPFFKDCNHQFIIAVTSLLEMISLPANIIVFNAGDEGDAMYVVNSGVLHVLVRGIKIREVRKGAFFGEMALFLKRPRYANVVTSTYCTLYKLVRFHIERLFEGYPEYATLIPNRVEEMARALFGRHSGEAMIIPDQTLVNEGNEGKKPEGKKRFANLIRKHASKDKNKVAPAAEILGVSDLIDATKPPVGSPKMAVAALALHMSQASAIRPDGKKSFSEAPISAIESGPHQNQSSMTTSTRPPSETVALDTGVDTPKLSLALNDLYNHFGWSPSRAKRRYWWSKMLMATAIDNETKRRMWWLLMLQVILVLNWVLIPMQLAFLALRRNTWCIVTLNVVADLMVWADAYVNLNLTFIEDSEKIWDTTRTAIRYSKSWLLVDIICVFPYWFFAPSVHHALPRIPRLLRVVRLRGHLREIDDFFNLTSKQRLLLFGVLLVVLYHIVACLHFSVSYLEGFSHSYNAWIPSDDVYLASVNSSHYVDNNLRLYRYDDPVVFTVGLKQYFRSLYYAANVLTALGLTIEPASDTQYGVALIFMLSGFFITAIVVDNVQKRFTASAFEQKEFFATRSRIQLFLRRQNAPLVIHKRVNAFLDYWWSSHRGAVISELLEELPETIKQEILQNICQPVLQTLALLNGVRPVLSELERVFLDNARFILYGQGETVYRQGDFASGLFFLLSGEICIVVNGCVPRSIHQGGFFGTAALDLDGNAVSYTERVTATSGSMVLFVSRQHIQAMVGAYATLVNSLRALEKRLLDPKLAKASQVSPGGGGARNSRGGGGALFKRIARFDRVFDPDSRQMLAWETWLFLIMTLEWILIMFHICFGVSENRATTTDSVLMLIELNFAVDIYVRSHLGYSEFGNKVMIPKHIRKRYFRSREFVVDLISIVPFSMVNWGLPPSARSEALNFNKLLRLSKLPAHFMALENKYIKRTLELRLFKLVYYTFLLTHLFGCVWFDFASNASGLHSLIHDEVDNATLKSPFGASQWMPPASLENADSILQYFASLFWSFGLMSESSTGDLPKTVAQCICNIVTMTSGFFLFAYVIGNFSDTNELMDAENREFYSQLNSLRHLISHFKLPEPIAEKFKNYFFFKRFHSISQEHILERRLPPSLLTDIRMVHLRPMIAKVTFLAGMDASVTRMLVAQFNQELVVKDEFVYKFGEKGSDMFFVFTGVLFTLLPPEEFAREASVVERKSSLLVPKMVVNCETPPSIGTTPRMTPSTPRLMSMTTMKIATEMTKVNEIMAGNYFGENALFFNSVRTSFVQADTSCILYSLSRQSLELVFERYPHWKEKVLRIVTINQEQQRLNRLAYEEEHTSVMSSLMHQTERPSMRTECPDEEVLGFRQMKSIGGRRKASLTASTVDGLETIQDTRSVATRFLRLLVGLREALKGTTAQSRYHLIWLKLISAATVYVSILVPYRISFDPLTRSGWISTICVDFELLCEFLFLFDIWCNWNLKGGQDSMELYEQDHRRSYVKERLTWDLVAAFPLDYLLYSISPSPWYRINRCVKVINLVHYMHEINRRSISNEMKRLRIACLMYMLLIYWTACSYFAIATYDQYGAEWNAWPPSSVLKVDDVDNPTSKHLTMRLLRGLFYGTTAFVKKGKTFTPYTTPDLVFTIVSSFVGLLVMAFMIGEIASLFISYIGNEVEYRKNHIAVELYLNRWKIHGELKVRTQAFLSSLWSSHRGVDYQSLLEEVPSTIRMESVLEIAHWPLKAFTDNVFRPIGRSSASETQQRVSLDLLTQGLAQHLKFEGYPRGERVLVEGSISKAMYFVVRGNLRSASRSQFTALGQLSYGKGDYFGESGLLGYSVSACTVSTMRACDLLSLSSEALLHVLHAHPTYSLALKLADSASGKMKHVPLAANLRTMEMRWAQLLIDAVNEERGICDQPTTDRMTRRQMKKTRATLDRFFVTRTTEECYVSFRPFLQIIVPNGFVHLHGAPRALAKQSSQASTLVHTDSNSATYGPGIASAGSEPHHPALSQSVPPGQQRSAVPKASKAQAAAATSQRRLRSTRSTRSARSTGRVRSVREHEEEQPDADLDSLLNCTVDAYGCTPTQLLDVEMEKVRRGSVGPSGSVLSPRSVRSGRSPSPSPSMHRRSVM